MMETAPSAATDFYRVRRGAPRFRARIESGKRATIVAYGTSMTASGEYLAAVLPALGRAYPRADVRLKRQGRNGFDTVMAAFDARSIAADEPDLVLLEFSLNDHSKAAWPLIVPALLGLMTQIRQASPECEFVFVYLARPVDAVSGNLRAIEIHDVLAGTMGLPSIDLARLAAQLVAQGAATYSGNSELALTRDGVHHTEAAARLIGIPFGAALVAAVGAGGPPDNETRLPALGDSVAAMLRHSGGALDDVIVPTFAFDAPVFGKLLTDRFDFPNRENDDPIRYVDMVCVPQGSCAPANASATLFERARRTSPRDYVAAGQWGVGQTKQHAGNLQHAEDLVVAIDPGAALRFPACGSFACFTGFASGGALAVRIDGAETIVRPPVVTAAGVLQHWPLAITNGLADRRHVIEIITGGEMMAFSDIFYIEPPA